MCNRRGIKLWSNIILEVHSRAKVHVFIQKKIVAKFIVSILSKG